MLNKSSSLPDFFDEMGDFSKLKSLPHTHYC